MFQILIFFCVKIATPPWKKSSHLSQQPFSKSWGPAKAPLPTLLEIWLEVQPHQQKGDVYTMRKPLKLIANMSKKSVGCDNESWWHNFSNPKKLLRFNRLKDLNYNDVMELSLLPQLTDFLEYG